MPGCSRTLKLSKLLTMLVQSATLKNLQRQCKTKGLDMTDLVNRLEENMIRNAMPYYMWLRDQNSETKGTLKMHSSCWRSSLSLSTRKKKEAKITRKQSALWTVTQSRQQQVLHTIHRVC